MIKDLVENNCRLINEGVPTFKRQFDKSGKYTSLEIEMQKIWDLIIATVSAVTGTIRMGCQKHQDNMWAVIFSTSTAHILNNLASM